MIQKLKSTIVREYVQIALGLLIFACGWKGFLLPHHFVGGGASGVGALIYYATGFPIFATYFIVNAILLAIAIRSIGLDFSIRTIYGVAVVTVFFAIIPEAPIGTFVKPNEHFMAAVVGGMIEGVGIGLVFLANGSSGGVDIIAKILNSTRNITLGRAMLYVDVFIISSSIFLKDGSIEKIVYGLVCMGVATYTIDLVVNGVRQSVQFFIFTKKHEEIADAINTQLDRGVTLLDGTGWYSKDPIKVVTVLARKNQSTTIFKIVKDIDPQAFVSQTAAAGVYGEGFDVMKTK